jgi:phage recombination protein Bet
MGKKNELAPSGGSTGLAMHNQSKEALDLIRKTIAADCDELEFSFFMEVAKQHGLNPFMKQIYPIARWNNTKDPKTGEWKKVKKITHQTSIDGFRAIADDTKQYAGSSAPIFSDDLVDGKYPEWCKISVRKIIDGNIFEVGAIAYWNEFKQDFYDKNTKLTTLGNMWAKMPRHMLAKCTEALALRKAFPSKLGNLYTYDEMAQASNTAPETTEPEEPKNITPQKEPVTKTPEQEKKPVVEDKKQIQDLSFKLRQSKTLDELKSLGDELKALDSECKITDASKKSLRHVYKGAYDRLKAASGYDVIVEKLNNAKTIDDIVAIEKEASKDKSLTTEQAVQLQELAQLRHDNIVEAQSQKGGDPDDIPFT